MSSKANMKQQRFICVIGPPGMRNKISWLTCREAGLKAPAGTIVTWITKKASN